MSHFILTGAPGAGKTVVLRRLQALGYAVVEEAATDVIAAAHAKGIAEPHLRPEFIDDILLLQEQRRRAAAPMETVFHDRSPICTLALAEFLDYPVSRFLAQAIAAIEAERFYAPRVFFVRNLGFIVNTEARRITFEDTLRFEQVHEEVYSRLGYELIFVEPAPASHRARRIIAAARAVEPTSRDASTPMRR